MTTIVVLVGDEFRSVTRESVKVRTRLVDIRKPTNRQPHEFAFSARTTRPTSPFRSPYISIDGMPADTRSCVVALSMALSSSPRSIEAHCGGGHAQQLAPRNIGSSRSDSATMTGPGTYSNALEDGPDIITKRARGGLALVVSPNAINTL